MLRHIRENSAHRRQRPRLYPLGFLCGRAVALLALLALCALPSGFPSGTAFGATIAYAQPKRASAPEQAGTMQNPGFETGDLTGWKASSSDLVTVVESHTAPNTNYEYVPPDDGKYFALLEPSDPEVYSTLSQNFGALAGDVLRCWSFFDGEDAPDWNDHGEVRILTGNTMVATVYTGTVASAYETGYLPWSQWAYTVTVAGNYTLEARVANAVDNTMPSYLGLDGCQVTHGAPENSFNASAAGGQVAITWQTSGETGTAGFNLYRAPAESGPYDRLNPALIPARGGSGANSYSYNDFPGAGTYFYKLETISSSGGTQQQGPLKVQASSPFRRPPRQPVPPRQ
jgi:hypothetical protein